VSRALARRIIETSRRAQGLPPEITDAERERIADAVAPLIPDAQPARARTPKKKN
jgi:hypothetical protein